MRKLLLLLVLSLTHILGFAADWRIVTTIHDGAVYGDTQGISIANPGVNGNGTWKVWFMTIYSKMQKDRLGSYKEEKNQYLVDCMTHRLAPMQSIRYTPSGDPRIVMYPVSVQSAEFALQDPIPDSVGESMVTSVCGK